MDNYEKSQVFGNNDEKIDSVSKYSNNSKGNSSGTGREVLDIC